MHSAHEVVYTTRLPRGRRPRRTGHGGSYDTDTQYRITVPASRRSHPRSAKPTGTTITINQTTSTNTAQMDRLSDIL